MSYDMNKADLDELAAAYARAAPGPWQQDGYRAYCTHNGERTVIFETKSFDAPGLNVEAIVALHNAWPALLEELAYHRALLGCTDVGEAVALAREAALEEAASLITVSCATSEAGEELAEQIRALKETA